uniref:Uncharacterized protein n=1 Tax=Oryza punctata TaxID=4537 RepID=A0A0E0MNN6_ORYPU
MLMGHPASARLVGDGPTGETRRRRRRYALPSGGFPLRRSPFPRCTASSPWTAPTSPSILRSNLELHLPSARRCRQYLQTLHGEEDSVLGDDAERSLTRSCQLKFAMLLNS